MALRKVFKRYGNVFESFVYKTSSKKNDELITKADAAFVPDGVYILHDTLGVKGVEGWNPEDNEGGVGILLVNKPVDRLEDAESDFNGEMYCQKLDSPDFPAAYYCLNYKKGGRNWHLPSSGELWMIYRYLEEIQNALETVGGQKCVTTVLRVHYTCLSIMVISSTGIIRLVLYSRFAQFLISIYLN